MGVLLNLDLDDLVASELLVIDRSSGFVLRGLGGVGDRGRLCLVRPALQYLLKRLGERDLGDLDLGRLLLDHGERDLGVLREVCANGVLGLRGDLERAF